MTLSRPTAARFKPKTTNDYETVRFSDLKEDAATSVSAGACGAGIQRLTSRARYSAYRGSLGWVSSRPRRKGMR